MRPLTRTLIVVGLLASASCGGAKEGAAPAAADRDVKAAAGNPAPGQPAEAGKPVPRKIIFTATVDVVVEDFGDAADRVQELTQANDGYVANSEVRGSPGTPRTGNWTLRVPVDHFADFLKALTALGEVRRNALESDDITDKYYDLAAHVKTDEVEEEALRKLLEKANDHNVVLALRKELNSLRGQIEQQKGQLERWSKQAQLATVRLTLTDRRDYTPPSAPDFGRTVGGTFDASLQAMTSVGKALVLTAVALAPWLAVLGLLAILTRPLWRRKRRLPPA
jgi:hypothetical protein